LLIGTKDGHLLVYSVHNTVGRVDNSFEINLDRSNKSFAKSKILQMEVVTEYHLLVSISGESWGIGEY